MKWILSWLSVVLALSGTVSAAPDDKFTAGAWEFSVHYDLIGVPQRFPGYSTTQCLNEQKPYPDISPSGSECHSQPQGRFGRTVTWTVDCSTEWEMVQGMGRLHFWKDTAIGDVHLQVLNPHNPPQPMVFHMEGKYRGPCSGS